MDSHRYTCEVLRAPEDRMADEVRAGLTAPKKYLPCKYFYDATGVHIYEQITRLEEYYPPRVEAEILREQATAMLRHCAVPMELVELGNASRLRTRLLIEPCLARQPKLTYYAVDIAEQALRQSAAGLLEDYSGLRFVGLAGEFADGLAELASRPGPARLVLFLGSTIGNMDAGDLNAFFVCVRQSLRANDRFLLGFDLPKDSHILERAYDDSEGVTARFNLNILTRLNRELGADFNLQEFFHRAVFNAPQSRVEMHLVSKQAQTVRVRALDLEVHFHKGETIHSENSFKHPLPAMQATLERHGFRVLGTFMDRRQWFCHILFT